MKELTGKQLESDTDFHSARFATKIGDIIVIEHRFKKTALQCVDKVIMPIDICPHCKSKNTFHSRCQKINSITFRNNEGTKFGNVWDTRTINTPEYRIFAKYDYCFECSRTFLIEMYFYKIVYLGLCSRWKYIQNKI